MVTKDTQPTVTSEDQTEQEQTRQEQHAVTYPVVERVRVIDGRDELCYNCESPSLDGFRLSDSDSESFICSDCAESGFTVRTTPDSKAVCPHCGTPIEC